MSGENSGSGAIKSDLLASLLVLNLLKLGPCGRRLSRRHIGHPKYPTIKQNWILPLGGENTERKIISIRLSSSTKSKGVKKEMRKQIVLSSCFTGSKAHPPPGT